MKTIFKTLFAAAMLAFTTDEINAQVLNANTVYINDPTLGDNGDYVTLHRADVIGDRAKFRITMGDEYTSDFELGYYFYANGQWTTNFSVDGYGNSFIRGYVGIGTTQADQRLTVNGKVKAEEVIVVVDVPADYVFDEGYTKIPLEDLSKYIEANNHLPNIPSASELKSNGWHVGEMSNKLLEKVEELTLYVIEIKKENDRQQKLIEEQKKLIDQLLQNHSAKN